MDEKTESEIKEFVNFLFKAADTQEKKQRLLQFAIVCMIGKNMNTDCLLERLEGQSKESLNSFIKQVKELDEIDFFNLKKQMLGEILS